MKQFSCLLAALIVFAHARLNAVETSPVRLAIVAEEQTLAASDLLAATLSANDHIVLLERTEIQKILEEQKLSAHGLIAKDALKLGQIIGADGLLTLELAKEGTNMLINARLIAVKPGVVLDLQQSIWPLKDLPGWSKILGDRFKPLLPKLGILPKEAVPISILNLRSAVSSPQGIQTERDLTLLLLNRLPHETNVFVLERRRLDQLAEEKKLNNLEETPFWNGAYLLEGTIDKNGFEKETITISAQMRGPDGTTSTFEVAGSRNELPKVINDFAIKVLGALQQTNSGSWKPAEEAKQYFNEATWALRWGMVREAQTASESAWALGKQDIECASVRVNSYIPDVLAAVGGYRQGSYTGLDTESWRKEVFAEIKSKHGARGVARISGLRSIDYAVVPSFPAPGKLDQAMHLLELYANFTSTLPEEEPALGSEWHGIGVRVLEAASGVLQHFHFVGSTQSPVAEKLAEVRQLCRLVADRISKPQSVRNSYWVGSRIATHDELSHTIGEKSNFFRIKMDYGWLWQDHPEEGVAVYRELMSSDVFIYIHKQFWMRPIQSPWLATWNSDDAKRAPALWKSFVQELEASTNVLHRIEAKCLKVRAAMADAELEPAFNDLFSTILTNRGVLVSNNVEVVYLNLGLDDILDEKDSNIVTPLKEKLERSYYKEYGPQISGMRDEYWALIGQRRDRDKHGTAFETGKEYLRTNPGTNQFEFFKLFASQNYSSAEAKEIAPLLQSFKERSVRYFQDKTGLQKAHSSAMQSHIKQLERKLEAAQGIVTTPVSTQRVKASVNPSPAIAKPNPAPRPNLTPKPAPTLGDETNALAVTRFFALPLKEFHANHLEDLKVFAHRFREEKLLLDLRWGDSDETGFLGYRSGVAIFDPKTETWELAPLPVHKRNEPAPFGFMGEVERGLFMELFEGDLYASEWNGIKKFDSNRRQWELLNLPDQKMSQLFAINHHLYASNDEGIFEILEKGKSMRILASCRRRPAASTLDSLTSLSSPVLLPGPDGTIRTIIGGKTYAWTGQDWTMIMSIKADQPPTTIGDTTILRYAPFGQAASLSLLLNDSTNAQLYLLQPRKDPTQAIQSIIGLQRTPQRDATKPKWKLAENLTITEGSCTRFDSKWLFLTESKTPMSGGNPRQGISHFRLVCYETNTFQPLTLPITFATNLATPPTAYMKPAAGIFNGNMARWMGTAGHYMILGHALTPGVWAIPATQLDGALSSAREIAVSIQGKAVADEQQLRRELLNQYDRNKNGSLDESEKSAIIADPRWLELHWAEIDLDKNHFLDDEDNLLFFDIDANGTASPNEMAAIKTIQRTIATALLRQFDVNGDGTISPEEESGIRAREEETTEARRIYFRVGLNMRFDHNNDGRLDKEELVEMLEQLTLSSILTAPKLQMSVRMANLQASPNSADRNKQLTTALEAIWKEERSSPAKK